MNEHEECTFTDKIESRQLLWCKKKLQQSKRITRESVAQFPKSEGSGHTPTTLKNIVHDEGRTNTKNVKKDEKNIQKPNTQDNKSCIKIISEEEEKIPRQGALLKFKCTSGVGKLDPYTFLKVRCSFSF